MEKSLFSVLKSIVKGIKITVKIVLGMLVFLPLASLIPKKKSLVFITRFGKSFEGNLKYLYLNLLNNPDPEFEYCFLTESKEILKTLKTANMPVLYHPSISSFWYLLRAGGIVVDGNEWAKGKFKYQILCKARKYQLWHGSGMKTVGMQKVKYKNWNIFTKTIKYILGKHPMYDVVVLPSKLQLETRSKAFNAKQFFINGQPRNDVLFLDDVSSYLTGADELVYFMVKKSRQEGKKIVMYAPTHRMRTESFLALKDTLVVSELDEFGKKHNILFVFKYHPKTIKEHEYNISGFSSIVEYNKFADGYPLFGLVDLMITDYSSIFVDYILLDRPVLFFPFDYDHYVYEERPLQFNYKTVTPGKKCYTHTELLNEIESLLINGNDPDKVERRKVLEVFYDVTSGGSSQRMWQEILRTW